MEIFSKATYNVGQLEDAILYIIQVCGGCLTSASLDKFAQIYARRRGKKFKQNQAVSRWMLPRMRSRGGCGNSKRIGTTPSIQSQSRTRRCRMRSGRFWNSWMRPSCKRSVRALRWRKSASFEAGVPTTSSL